MRLLLTGITGVLGTALLKKLNKDGSLKLRALARRRESRFEGCEMAAGDLLDCKSLLEATQDMDAVLHLAALTHTSREAEYFRINVEGTKNLLRACAQNKVRRFIHVSSAAASADGGAYAVSKLQAEECVRQSGLSWLILRPAEVYGAGPGEAIQKLIGWVRKFPVIPVIGDGQYTLSPVFVEDVVSSLHEAVRREEVSGEVVGLSGPEVLTFNELIDRLSGFFMIRRSKIHIPVSLACGIVEILSRLKTGVVTPDQIPRLLSRKSASSNSELLGHHPRPLEDGLRCLFPG